MDIDRCTVKRTAGGGPVGNFAKKGKADAKENEKKQENEKESVQIDMNYVMLTAVHDSKIFREPFPLEKNSERLFVCFKATCPETCRFLTGKAKSLRPLTGTGLFSQFFQAIRNHRKDKARQAENSQHGAELLESEEEDDEHEGSGVPTGERTTCPRSGLKHRKKSIGEVKGILLARVAMFGQEDETKEMWVLCY